MNFNFYADKKDKEQLLHFIFNDTDLHIYELSSAPGTEVQLYKNVEAIADKMETIPGPAYFQLWSPSFLGNITFRKIDLDPRRCNGHTFRYVTDGLGLIQLYLGKEKDAVLQKSHIGHFSEKGAIRNENFAATKAAQWNWKEIECVSRLLKYTIQKSYP